MTPEQRLLGIWGILIVLTIVSLESFHIKGWAHAAQLQGIVVILLAFIKVRLIILDFMEVRHAPLALRMMLNVWVVAASGGLIVMLLGIA